MRLARQIQSVALVLCAAILTACGGGAPSESDMTAALKKQMNADMQGMQAMAGSGAADMMKSMLPEIKSMKKVGCKEDGENAYRCDMEIEVAQMGRTTKGPVSMRFVKLSDGWGVQK